MERELDPLYSEMQNLNIQEQQITNAIEAATLRIGNLSKFIDETNDQEKELSLLIKK